MVDRPDEGPGSEPRLPPDLPPEYADAYRRGYERAWTRSHSRPDPDPEAPPAVQSDGPGGAPDEPSGEDGGENTVVVDPLTQAIGAAYGASHDGTYDGPLYKTFDDPFEDGDPFDDLDPAPWSSPTHRDPLVPRTPRWFPVLLVGFVVIALVISAYGLGRLFSLSFDSDDAQPAEPSSGNQTPATQDPGSTSSPPAGGSVWAGDIATVSGVTANSSCVLAPGQDAAGREIDYEPDRAVDGDFSTAWRCAGNGRGISVRLDLDEKVRLGQVGLVAGYAKSDPRSGTDRYAENSRLTRVRWTFGDGTSVVQELDGSPDHRTVQTMRIPLVETDTVVLELLASTPGPRRAVAISEVALGEAIGP